MRILLAAQSSILGVSLLLAVSAHGGLDTTRQEALQHLLRHDCGSCHGMSLEGGLGLPLTREALSGKSETYLYLTIRDGHSGTPMPPWSAILTEEEIRYLVRLLMQGTRQ